MNPAAVPAEKSDDIGDDRWMSQHLRFISEAKGNEPDVVFLGDSNIQYLGQTEVWREMFEPLHCLNFGITGDDTTHILWRLHHETLDHLTTKIVVLMVGTNNHGFKPEHTVGAIVEIVNVIRNKQPSANVIVLPILPRGEKPNALRTKNHTINTRLSEELDSLPNVTFLQYDEHLFLNKHDLTISHQDMFDYLHLTKRGYQKLCEPLLEEIQTVLQTFVKVPSTSVDSTSLAGELAGDK